MSRILVVDDEPDLCALLGFILERRGHEVAAAHDGVECLDVAARFRPDLVLLNLLMPRMDGFEAGRRLRSDSRFKNVPLILTTACGSHVAADAYKLGFSEVLFKPFGAGEVLAVVERFLRPATERDLRNALLLAEVMGAEASGKWVAGIEAAAGLAMERMGACQLERLVEALDGLSRALEEDIKTACGPRLERWRKVLLACEMIMEAASRIERGRSRGARESGLSGCGFEAGQALERQARPPAVMLRRAAALAALGRTRDAVEAYGEVRELWQDEVKAAGRSEAASSLRLAASEASLRSARLLAGAGRLEEAMSACDSTMGLLDSKSEPLAANAAEAADLKCRCLDGLYRLDEALALWMSTARRFFCSGAEGMRDRAALAYLAAGRSAARAGRRAEAAAILMELVRRFHGIGERGPRAAVACALLEVSRLSGGFGPGPGQGDGPGLDPGQDKDLT